MALNSKSLPEHNIALLACDISSDDLAKIMPVANRLQLRIEHLTREAEAFDDVIHSHCPIVLVHAAGCSDDALAELASRLTLGPNHHGGIVLIGRASGPAARQLANAGLLREVGFEISQGELIAAMLPGIENLRRAIAPSSEEGRALDANGFQESGPSREDDLLLPLLQKIRYRRRLRLELFPDGIFSDPAWDILLALAHARIERRPTQASNIGIEAGIPPSTALRRVKDLEIVGLVTRWGDPNDRRRDFVELSDAGLEVFNRYARQIAATPVG
jgi:DNA-binding MarR family transcriptional regulator